MLADGSACGLFKIGFIRHKERLLAVLRFLGAASGCFCAVLVSVGRGFGAPCSVETGSSGLAACFAVPLPKPFVSFCSITSETALV